MRTNLIPSLWSGLLIVLSGVCLCGCGAGSSAPESPSSPTLTSLTIAPTDPTTPQGSTEQFSATGVYSDSSTRDLTSQVSWASSNTVVATINASGQSKAIDSGSTNIQASLGGARGSTSQIVTAATVQSISVTPTNQSISVGAVLQFTATGSLSDGSTMNITNSVVWNSSNTAVVTINGTGQATAVGQGSATIGASSNAITGSTPLTVTVLAPTITTQPSHQSVAAGQTATFTVVASGSPPLGYQWLENTGSGFANISGATSTSYTTPVTTSANSGATFEVTISNSAGSVTSAAAALTVTVAAPTITAQPSNQNVTAGQMATFTVAASGSPPLSYQWLQNTGSGFANISGATSTSYTTPATTSGNNGATFEVTVSNSAGSVTSAAATLTVTVVAPTISTQPSNQSVPVGQKATFTVAVSGSSPLSYQWLENTGSGFANISGATASSYTTPATTSANNGTTFEVAVSNSAGSVTSAAATLTVTVVAPAITAQPSNQSVPVGQKATFTVAASGSSPLSYQWLQNTGSGFANISGATAASYTTPATTSGNNGTTFEVAVSNSAGSVTSAAATLTVTVVAPTITAQPSNQNVTVGQTATFTVAASGSSPLSYQWLENTGSGFANISGATAASYTTPATTSGNNGTTFEVTVSNSAGSVTSAAATLTVTVVAPTITAQPSNQNVTVGQTATFTVTASGSSPLSYQWLENTGSGFANISGATAASYTTPATTSGNNGTTFEVTVSNSAGSVTSNAATLTVTSGGPTSPSYGNGFTSSGLTLNGGATISGTDLQLTDGGSGESRSAFFNEPVNVQSFITDFTFQLISATANGFTFTIQNNSPTALGVGGSSLGYGPNTSSTGGIPNSIAVKFDLYNSQGEGNDSTGLYTDGASPTVPAVDMTSSGVNLHSGDVMSAHLAYDGATLTLIVTDTSTKASFGTTFAVDIPGTVGANTAYVGFTGGTGDLTATQNILTWIYNAVPVTAFDWPVSTPIVLQTGSSGGPNDFSTYDGPGPILGSYHTGIDVCPSSPGCAIGDAVSASSSGIVELALVVSDPSGTLCDGSSTAGYQINPNTSNLGNVVVIAHPNGKFSLYGHMDCIWPGVVPGLQVSAGTRIGNMGHSEFGERDGTFAPHTHFEMKDRAVTGDPSNEGYSGYVPDLPDGYGYHDARIWINPFTTTSISPTAVKNSGSSSLDVLTGPATGGAGTGFAFLATLAPGQELVAFASSGSWYEVYLPNDNAPIVGWIQATPDSSATQLQVSGASSSGLLIQAAASSGANLVSWDETFGNCNPSAKIWNGQRYVSSGSQNGFNEFYLPSNYYFSSASSCAEPTGTGPSSGWASTTFLH